MHRCGSAWSVRGRGRASSRRRCWRTARTLQLVAVWARRPRPRRALAARHGAVAVGSFDELLDDVRGGRLRRPARRAGRPRRPRRPGRAGGPAGQADRPRARPGRGAGRRGRVQRRGVPARAHEPLPTHDARLPRRRRRVRADGRAGHVPRRRLAPGQRRSPRRGVWSRVGCSTSARTCSTRWRSTLGPIGEVAAVGDPLGIVGITCTHEGGAFSQAAMSVDHARRAQRARGRAVRAPRPDRAGHGHGRRR